MARVQEDASKKECKRVRRVGTVDVAMDSGVGAILYRSLPSTAQEVKIMRQALMRCLGGKELGRGTQTSSVMSTSTGMHRDKEQMTLNYNIWHQRYKLKYVGRGGAESSGQRVPARKDAGQLMMQRQYP